MKIIWREERNLCATHSTARGLRALPYTYTVASEGQRATAASGAAAMMRGCILLIALSTISLVIVLARSAIYLLRTDDVTANAIEGGHIPRTRSLLQMPLSGLPPPGSSMSNDYPFSVIIISYHKTGVSLDCILLPELFLQERHVRNNNIFDPSRPA